MTPEIRRPLFHFTPPAHWINDPNGLIYHEGEYHLFYQYYPEGLVWGPMHWGHAISRDLIAWEHLPIALYPDAIGMIFSGSAVIDTDNTAGFGAGAMVAIFTHHTEQGQAQSLAFSADRGRTWEKYAGNPVIPLIEGKPDIRDPKVIWHEPTAQWVMVLAVMTEIWFYTSPDLKQWTKSGTFGAEHGSHGGIWETPDLFEIEVEGESTRVWVLTVGVQSDAPAGGSGTQYFIGSFDGSTFHCADTAEEIRWADYGADFYAAQSWSPPAGERRTWLAWMSNWAYAREFPASQWRGSMSLPREMLLVRQGGEIVLVQRPTPQFATLRGDTRRMEAQDLGDDGVEIPLACIPMDITAVFRAEQPGASFTIEFHSEDGADLTISGDFARQILRVWRRGLPQLQGFDQPHEAPLPGGGKSARLRILIDHGSAEIFAQDGQVVLTEQVLWGDGSREMVLSSQSGVRAEKLEIAPLASCGEAD